MWYYIIIKNATLIIKLLLLILRSASKDWSFANKSSQFVAKNLCAIGHLLLTRLVRLTALTRPTRLSLLTSSIDRRQPHWFVVLKDKFISSDLFASFPLRFSLAVRSGDYLIWYRIFIGYGLNDSRSSSGSSCSCSACSEIRDSWLNSVGHNGFNVLHFNWFGFNQFVSLCLVFLCFLLRISALTTAQVIGTVGVFCIAVVIAPVIHSRRVLVGAHSVAQTEVDRFGSGHRVTAVLNELNLVQIERLQHFDIDGEPLERLGLVWTFALERSIYGHGRGAELTVSHTRSFVTMLSPVPEGRTPGTLLGVWDQIRILNQSIVTIEFFGALLVVIEPGQLNVAPAVVVFARLFATGSVWRRTAVRRALDFLFGLD